MTISEKMAYVKGLRDGVSLDDMLAAAAAQDKAA